MSALIKYSAPAGDGSPWDFGFGYDSITRELIRSGLDLNYALSNCLKGPIELEQQEQISLEDPPKPLLDWAAFVRDQGFMIDPLGEDGTPVCMPHLKLKGCNERDMRQRTNTVFILCLLKADVSIRLAEAKGMQALHALFFFNTWSAELSLHVIDLAYILIHFGGADIHAVDYNNLSPRMYAFKYGWENEWLTVLDRCGIDKIEVLTKEIERLMKIRFLGNGEGTAIDTEDLSIPKSVSLLRRRRVVDAKLDE